MSMLSNRIVSRALSVLCLWIRGDPPDKNSKVQMNTSQHPDSKHAPKNLFEEAHVFKYVVWSRWLCRGPNNNFWINVAGAWIQGGVALDPAGPSNFKRLTFEMKLFLAAGRIQANPPDDIERAKLDFIGIRTQHIRQTTYFRKGSLPLDSGPPSRQQGKGAKEHVSASGLETYAKELIRGSACF